jgi:hypothetical protein
MLQTTQCDHANREPTWRRRMQLKTCGLALALAVLPMAAMAQSAAPELAREEARAKYRAACAADVQKFCASIERAKGAMRACLTAHETELSDACKAARAERAAARAKEKS